MAQPQSTPDDQYERDCVLYLRQSKGRAGIPRQRRDSQRKAEQLRWRVVAEFIDKDTTAYAKVEAEEFARRDDYQKMLAFLRADERPVPLGVLAWHADRIHRNTDEVKSFTRVCVKGPHPVETAKSGGYDLTTSTGRKRLRDDASDAEHEVDHLTERVVAQKDEAAAAGRWLGGKVPWGWKLKRVEDEDGEEIKVLVIDPGPAEGIRWAAEAVLLHGGGGPRAGAGRTLPGSLGAISREWNRRGLRRWGGGQWTPREVGQTLLRARNAGLYVHRGKIVEGIRGDWPAILDEEMWRAMSLILSADKRRTSPGPKPKWLGSGLYLCGVCGGSLRGGQKGGGRPGFLDRQKVVYKCRATGDGRTHVSRDAVELDRYVESMAIGWLAQRAVTDVIAAEEPPDLDEIRGRLAVQEAALRAWRARAEAGDLEPDDYIPVASATRKRIAEIKDELAQAVQSPLLADALASGDVVAYWDSKAGDLAWRRAMVNRLMAVTVRPTAKGRPAGLAKGEAYFDPDSIDIEWKVPLRGGRR